ncbi:hypothetical protein CGRA01v4_13819 [Colletotrichum graminicola]|nr:hypothetical protein CGRA01v4_13819 [Colletotrichum graminicola]
MLASRPVSVVTLRGHRTRSASLWYIANTPSSLFKSSYSVGWVDQERYRLGIWTSWAPLHQSILSWHFTSSIHLSTDNGSKLDKPSQTVAAKNHH